MRITAVARRLGCSPEFLRDLEKSGRIPPAPRDLNRHRRFSPEDIQRLKAVVFPEDHRKVGAH